MKDEREIVTVTIDGREVRAPKGESLIRVAQDNGTFIPRFCWHERMKPVGMCRACLVEVEGVRGMPPACTTTVTEGMVVSTKSESVKKAQDGVLEFLLINHPLDCPVCDRGGECPLQDQTLAFGPGESRYVEEKRHFEKPIPISELVLLDRERCIQCSRCTRFADDIAGDPLIDFGERGGEMQVITYPDDPFTSYFSGNTVQVCPVGALTAKPYRFRARPWDLSAVETSCQTCSVGCRGSLESSSNELVRLLGVDIEPVNHGWLCDKGRFGYEATHAEDRARNPMIRRDGVLVECSWPEALDAAAEGIKRSLDLHGPASIAMIGGSRGTNEDAYLWARLAKGVIGTDNVDAQIGDGLPPELVLGLPGATIPDLDEAAAIILLGPDLKEELPVLYLRVRRACVDLGVPILDVSAVDHGLSKYAAASIRHLPGEQASAAREISAALAPLTEGRSGPIVVVLGRSDVATSAEPTVAAAAIIRDIPNTRFLIALRRANVRGAIDLGLAPGFLPGRVTLDAGAQRFAAAWGRVPTTAGLDTAGILNAASEGRIGALILVGADIVNDFPDRRLVRAGVGGAGFIVCIDATITEAVEGSDVFLPATVWGEKAGTTTNLEGRISRVGRKIASLGNPMPDFRIASELALRLGTDFGLETVEEIQDEIARVAPAFSEVNAELLKRARDGVVLPLSMHRDELVFEHRRISVIDYSWEPIKPEALGDVELIDAVVVAPTSNESVPNEPVPNEPAEDESVPNEPAEDDPAATAALPDVELYVWSETLGTQPAPGRDNYALRLSAGRTLYDNGRTVSSTPALRVLVPVQTLRVNPSEIARVGVADGASVRVSTARGSLVLSLTADANVPAGVAVMPFNIGETGVADLVDVSLVVTDLRLETLR